MVVQGSAWGGRGVRVVQLEEGSIRIRTVSATATGLWTARPAIHY